jgi:hypothetical protein
VICHVTWSNRTRSPNDFVSSESWINAVDYSPRAFAVTSSTFETRNGLVR